MAHNLSRGGWWDSGISHHSSFASGRHSRREEKGGSGRRKSPYRGASRGRTEARARRLWREGEARGNQPKKNIIIKGASPSNDGESRADRNLLGQGAAGGNRGESIVTADAAVVRIQLHGDSAPPHPAREGRRAGERADRDRSGRGRRGAEKAGVARLAGARAGAKRKRRLGGGHEREMCWG